MQKKSFPEIIRFILLTILLTQMAYFSVMYMNAMHYYEQQVPLKHICIIFGLAVLILMDVKCWFQPFSLIYLPLWFFGTRIAYEKHWIPDVCNYTHVDVLRLDKVTILVWGLVIIALLFDLIKNKTWKNLKNVPKPFLILWGLYALWLTVFQQKSYAYVLLFSIGFSSLYYVFSNKKRQGLFMKALLYGLIFSSFIVLYKSLRYRPYDTDRYNGFFHNSNNAGFYYTCVFLALLAKITDWWNCNLKKRIKVPVLILFYLYTGIFGAINLFNYTRTTLMGMLFAILVLFVLELIKKRKQKKGFLVLRYALVLISMIALFNVTYLAIRYLPAKTDNPHFFTWECNEEINVLKGDPVDSPKYTSMTQYLRMFFGKWGIYIKVDDVEANEFEQEHGNDGVTIDTSRDVTNGRTRIWKDFLPRMRFLGHDPGHIIREEDGEVIFHAHNTYFQTAYQFGIPAGLLLLLLTMYSLFQTGKQVLKKKELTGDRVFSFLMIGTCFIGMLTEWIGHPAYILCFALYTCFGFSLHDQQNEAA